jgi:hypothetical protein
MSSENRVADKLGNLRHYGRPNRLQPSNVQPGWNPINHSLHEGFGTPPSQRSRVTDLLVSKFSASIDVHFRRMWSEEVGVGTECVARPVSNDPDAVTTVRRANVGRRDTMPFRIEPERMEISKDGVQSASAKLGAVFDDNDPRCDLVDKPCELAPKSAARIFESSTLAGDADTLAGKAPADCVNGNSIGSKSLCGKLSNVMVTGHLGPVFREDAAGKLFDLAERDGLEPARPLQAEREPAYTAEQVEKLEGLHSPLPRFGRIGMSGPSRRGCDTAEHRNRTGAVARIGTAARAIGTDIAAVVRVRGLRGDTSHCPALMIGQPVHAGDIVPVRKAVPAHVNAHAQNPMPSTRAGKNHMHAVPVS